MDLLRNQICQEVKLKDHEVEICLYLLSTVDLKYIGDHIVFKDLYGNVIYRIRTESTLLGTTELRDYRKLYYLGLLVPLGGLVYWYYK